MEKVTEEQINLKDAYLHNGNLKFTIEIGKYRNKLIGTSTKSDENFRAFAYFTTSSEDAKTSILMEYKQLSWSKYNG